MNQQKNLNELREKRNQLLDIISQDISNWNPQTRSGMEGLIRRSKEELEEITPIIVNEILKKSTTALILNDVPQVNEIMEACASSDDMVLLDYLVLEKQLVKKIYGNQTSSFSFNSETVSKLNILLGELGDTLNVISMPAVPGNVRFEVLATKNDIVNKFNSVLELAFGFDLKKLYLGHLITKGASELVDSNSLTVVIGNVPVNAITALNSIAGRTVTLTSDESVTGALLVSDALTPEKFLKTFSDLRELDSKGSVDSKKSKKMKKVQ